MINKSIWLKGIRNRKSKKLEKDIETDILIIGGGITGLTTAYFLRNTKYKITLVESNKIASGQSSKSTGKLTYLQGLIYNKIENIYNTDTALKYMFSQKEAIEIVKDIIIENNIKCDYESNNSYVFTNKKNNIYKLNRLEKILDKSKTKYSTTSSIPIKLPCKYAVKVTDTAVFNPVKYLLSLKTVLDENISIYENSIVTKIDCNNDSYIVSCGKNKIKTKKIVLACHYPFFISPYFFPFKTGINKGYLCASKVDKIKRFNAISEEDNIKSIRYHSDSKNYIVYVGEERSLGSNIDNEVNYENLFSEVQSKLSKDIKYYWFNYDIITSDHLPLIGYLNENNKDIIIATGYNSWGMTNGTIAGKIIYDLINNEPNKYIELFNPNRVFNICKIKNFIMYNYINSTNYVKSKFINRYSFYKNLDIKYNNIEKSNIFIDEFGKKHITLKKCPHMGCDLIFNTVERTWDCPCHGSRFNINGKIVKGPSIKSISIDKSK